MSGKYSGRPVALKELYAQKMDSEDIAEFKSVTLLPISCLSPPHTHKIKAVTLQPMHPLHGAVQKGSVAHPSLRATRGKK